MEDFDIISLLIGFIMTAVAYMAYPIYVYKSSENLTNKRVIKIVILNGLICFIVFAILLSISGANATLSGTSAIFYSGINYWLLSKKIQKENNKTENNNEK